MNVLTEAVWSVVRLGLLAGVIVFASVGVGQESQPASASHTQVIMSYSDVFPLQTPLVVINPEPAECEGLSDPLPNWCEVTRDIYIWAVNVDNDTGVSNYHLEIGFDGSNFTAASFEAPLPLWLDNSGRFGTCVPAVETNRVFMDCVTPGGVPPYGATGTGLIGKLTIQPGSGPDGGLLDLTGTFLADTPDDFESAPIPLTLLSSFVVYRGCADINDDGLVDLINDILGIIGHFQWTPTYPEGPGGGPNPFWDPAYDLNNDGIVDLINDILGAIDQFQLICWQPPSS